MIENNATKSYKKQHITARSKESLTLLLYNAAIRFIAESIECIEKGDLLKSHTANMKAQDIVKEFMITLDMKYEIARTWLPLYEYILYCLFQGNIKKNKPPLLEAISLLSELQEAWTIAVKNVSSSPKEEIAVNYIAKPIWLQYHSLTKAMLDSLKKKDMKNFYKYMAQRKNVQEMLDTIKEDDFKHCNEGKTMLLEIESDNHFITSALRHDSSRGMTRHPGASFYENDVGTSISYMSWKR